MPSHYRLSLLILLLALSGCGSLVTGSLEEDDHEEEHLDHHVPAHRPSGFTEAVDQMERRYQKLSELAGADGAVPEEEGDEFSDILTWLPEIAADSDMQRADWEQVDTLSAKSLQSFQAWRAAGFPGESPQRIALETCIDKLKSLRGAEHPSDP